MVCVSISVAVKRTMYQLKVDVDMLNAVKSVLADGSSISPSSEQRDWTIELGRQKWKTVPLVKLQLGFYQN